MSSCSSFSEPFLLEKILVVQFYRLILLSGLAVLEVVGSKYFHRVCWLCLLSVPSGAFSFECCFKMMKIFEFEYCHKVDTFWTGITLLVSLGISGVCF